MITALPSWRTFVETATQLGEFPLRVKHILAIRAVFEGQGEAGPAIYAVSFSETRSKCYFFLTLVESGPYTECKIKRWLKETERSRDFALLSMLFDFSYLI